MGPSMKPSTLAIHYPSSCTLLYLLLGAKSSSREEGGFGRTSHCFKWVVSSYRTGTATLKQAVSKSSSRSGSKASMTYLLRPYSLLNSERELNLSEGRKGEIQSLGRSLMKRVKEGGRSRYTNGVLETFTLSLSIPVDTRKETLWASRRWYLERR